MASVRGRVRPQPLGQHRDEEEGEEEEALSRRGCEAERRAGGQRCCCSLPPARASWARARYGCLVLPCLAAALWVALAFVETPALNFVLGKEESHPPAYIKSFTLNLMEQGIFGECRQPGDVRFTGPEVNALHYIWVTLDPGCTVKLKDWYTCSLESALAYLPGVPITIWIVQPPLAFLEAERRAGWQPCSQDSHVSIQTRHGAREVLVRPIVPLDNSTLGRWYSSPQHALSLWTFKKEVPFAEISDFFRILALQQYGGMYIDFDYVLLSPQLHFIEDGAGKEYPPGDLKRFGGHAVANSFLKFRRGSPVLDDIAADILSRIFDPFAENFGYIGMGGVTRTYLDHRFRRGCSGMDWTAYGRKTVFKDACEDFDSGVMLGMHWKLVSRSNGTCRGAVQAVRLACPVSLSRWDAAHGLAGP